jgi:hypothetical protein
VIVSGTLFKGGGGFEIDHPLDPANRYLRHSFVECPEMLNVYSGNVTTDGNGEACVALPDYFEALNEDFRYQLTVIGQFAQVIVAQEVKNNQFTIRTERPGVKVSWQVSGTRRDPWAVANRIAVEEDKAGEEKGRYLHPKPWWQQEEAMIHRTSEGEHELRQMREDQLRRVGQLVPEALSQRLERSAQGLLRGDPVDREELQGLAADARRLAEPQAAGEPSRIDRPRLEEAWRQVEETVQAIPQSMPSYAPERPRVQPRQFSQLMPEPLRHRVEERLQAVLRGERVDGQELRSLAAEARRQAELPAEEEPPSIDRARLEEAWRRVEELVQRLR